METGFIIGFIILLFIYMLPSMIAYNRGSINTGLVIFLNIFFGWLFLPWFLCIFLAVGKTKNDINRENEIYNALTKK